MDAVHDRIRSARRRMLFVFFRFRLNVGIFPAQVACRQIAALRLTGSQTAFQIRQRRCRRQTSRPRSTKNDPSSQRRRHRRRRRRSVV